MKWLSVLWSFAVVCSYAQDYEEYYEKPSERIAVTIGILQGGGSLLGADLEVLLAQRVGVQVGAGLLGFGTAANFHFRPDIRSSVISLTYWNQGIGPSFVQNALGSSFVYRGKKWFTAQLGLGKTLSKGPAFPENSTQPPVMLLYSIGGYSPIR